MPEVVRREARNACVTARAPDRHTKVVGAPETASTSDLWVYDLRTNQHFTLKQNPLRREHLQEFVDCYRAGARGTREESERFKRFAYDELLARDKVSLDLTWLRDDSLEDLDNLPPPDVIAREIVDDLQAALVEFAAVADSLAARDEIPRETALSDELAGWPDRAKSPRSGE